MDTEGWREFNRLQKEARKERYSDDLAKLVERRVPHEEKGNGEILLNGFVQYWPKHGKYFCKRSKRRGRGMDRAIQLATTDA